MHILLTNVHLDCRGEGSSNRNVSRDESVETGVESVEAGDESIEAREKTPQSCYNAISDIPPNLAYNSLCYKNIYHGNGSAGTFVSISRLCSPRNMKNGVHCPRRPAERVTCPSVCGVMKNKRILET